MALFVCLSRFRRELTCLCAGGLLLLMAAKVQAQRNALPVKGLSAIVRTDGELVEGIITRISNGYSVKQRFGTLVFSFDEVRLEARTRSEAFRKYKATLPDKSTVSSMKLAKWAYKYKLYSECRSELRYVLQQEPDRRDAREFLKYVEEILNPTKPIHKGNSTVVRRTFEGMMQDDAKSLIGLSPDTAREFMVKVQPVLMNNCANASCHGSAATNDFKLKRVRFGVGSNRVLVEKNLAAILKYVDRRSPENSRILTVLKKRHGKGSRGIFHGPSGASQWGILRNWVKQVSTEIAPSVQTGPSIVNKKPVFLKTSDVLGSSKNQKATSDKQPSKNQQASFEKQQGDSGKAKTNTIELIEEILKEERLDPFDPDEFNRLSENKVKNK